MLNTNIKYLLFWLFSMLMGLFLGVSLGLSIAFFSNKLSINLVMLIILTLLFVGVVAFFWLLPLENKYVSLKILNNEFNSSNIDQKYKISPFTFFILAGTLIGETHYYNVINGGHCILPIFCPYKYCVLQYCF